MKIVTARRTFVNETFHILFQVLAELASLENVRVIATVDHINSPLLWDEYRAQLFNWLWYESHCRYIAIISTCARYLITFSCGHLLFITRIFPPLSFYLHLSISVYIYIYLFISPGLTVQHLIPMKMKHPRNHR